MNPLDFINQDWENDQYRLHRPGFGTPHGPLDRPPKFEGPSSLSEVFMMLKTNGGEDQEESFDAENQQDRQF